MFRRQPSCDGTSRMTRECQVGICERLGAKFPGPTRHSHQFRRHKGALELLLGPDSGRNIGNPATAAMCQNRL
jgi:hypothetical protein